MDAIEFAIDAMRATARVFDLPPDHILRQALECLVEFDDSRDNELMVSLIDFQMTIAHLSVAEDALREEPYERLPYLAGTVQTAQSHLESLRQEAIECKRVLHVAMEACRVNLEYAGRKNEKVLHDAFLQCQEVLKHKKGFKNEQTGSTQTNR